MLDNLTPLSLGDTTKRMKKRKRFFDETDSDETDLSPRKKFRVNTYNSVLDCLSNELHKRACAYDEITKMFGFLSEFESMSLEATLFTD